MEEKTERGYSIATGLPPLVFMGTPEFAVPSLRKLAEAGAPILLVVTQPDRPSGRGKKVTLPPIKLLAQELGIPVFQPDRVRKPEAIDRIRSAGAECAVVVAFGQILPQALLDVFPLGALNVHASLLPKYRGAAPVHRAILEGDSGTGISVMLLDAGMDTGPVLTRRGLEIGDRETFGELHDRLAAEGAELLIETLKGWKAGSVAAEPQDDAHASYAPPLGKEQFRLEWTQPAERIVSRIRAFDPQPGAFFMCGGKRVKCFRASLLSLRTAGQGGEVVGLQAGGLVVLGGDGRSLLIGELQMEGQRRVSAPEFVRGRPLPPGTRLE